MRCFQPKDGLSIPVVTICVCRGGSLTGQREREHYEVGPTHTFSRDGRFLQFLGLLFFSLPFLDP